jgi:lysophospholipase L1-like esterase
LIRAGMTGAATGARLKTILCYGDSNTFGTATRPGDDERYEPNERWPGVLQKRLGKEWTVIAEGLPGRTTVHADPIEGRHMDGSAYLLPCLRSHRPLDAVAIMLGTNDLKRRFSVTPLDIANSVGALLTIVQQSESGPKGGAPKILVICPPPILNEFGARPDIREMFEGGYEKSLKLAPYYKIVAKEYGAAFLNAGEVIRSSPFDGIHFDKSEQTKLGRAVAETIAKVGW